jgi:membrane protease YdiL (CAAX protease family)
VAEDLRTAWDGVDLLVFSAFAVGLLVVLTNVAAVVAVVALGVRPDQVNQYLATDAGLIVARQAIWFGTLLLYLHMMLRRRTAEPYWRALGWHALRQGARSPAGTVPLLFFAGAGLALFVSIVSQHFTTEKRLPIEALFTTRRSVAWLMAFGILVAPAVEETVFRGFLYPVLARKFSVAGGIALTGIVFGLVHAPQLWGGWKQIGLLVFVGMVLTAVRAAARSVFASFLVHLGYNSFIFGGFFLATDALRRLPH